MSTFETLQDQGTTPLRTLFAELLNGSSAVEVDSQLIRAASGVYSQWPELLLTQDGIETSFREDSVEFRFGQSRTEIAVRVSEGVGEVILRTSEGKPAFTITPATVQS